MGGRATLRRMFAGPTGQSVSGLSADVYTSAQILSQAGLPTLGKSLGDDSSDSGSSASNGKSTSSWSTSTSGVAPSITYDHVVDEIESLVDSLEEGYDNRSHQEADR